MRLTIGVGRFHRDARLFLLTTFVAGAALSLYWIDFNLYLASLGLSTATIGLVSTIASVAGAAVAFPASAASDRFGRRTIIAAGIAIGLIALLGLLLTESLPLIVVFAALWSVGQQSFQVVQAPFLTEHSDPEHRNELFAVQFAVQHGTSIAAALLGGVGAAAVAATIGLAGGTGDPVRRHERPLADRLGRGRHLVHAAPGDRRVRSRVHGQLHHDHHAVLHRHGAVLGVVPGRRPQALQPGLIRCDRTSLTVRRAISAPIASMPTSMADRWRPATSPWCSSSDVA